MGQESAAELKGACEGPFMALSTHLLHHIYSEQAWGVLHAT